MEDTEDIAKRYMAGRGTDPWVLKPLKTETRAERATRQYWEARPAASKVFYVSGGAESQRSWEARQKVAEAEHEMNEANKAEEASAPKA